MVVLTFRHDRHELGPHASKDEQESHRDVIGKLAYRLRFFVISGVTPMANNQDMDLESLIINFERY